MPTGRAPATGRPIRVRDGNRDGNPCRPGPRRPYPSRVPNPGPRTRGTRMAATAVLPRPPADHPSPTPGRARRAAAYERVLHQLVRCELRMLGELATWADPVHA